MRRFCVVVLLIFSTAFGQTPAELNKQYGCNEVQPTAPKLRLELLRRAKADQKAREKSDGDAIAAVDKKNTDRLSELLKTYEWLDISLVGCDGTGAAWLIAQHADSQIIVQKLALERLERAFAKRQAMPYQVAYLTDRVRVNWGQKQMYGTQTEIVNGKAVPKPLENPKAVDKRRAAVGLTPLADYLSQMNRMYDENN